MVNKVVKAGRIPAVLIGWNIFDALLHVAIDMAEPLRITGNIIAILVAVAILIGAPKKLSSSLLLAAFISIVAMLNYLLGFVGTSIDQILGLIFQPLAWAMGVPWEESAMMGTLMGKKIAFTELIAYGDLKSILDSGRISDRTAIIASYALCGFANFGSIGIQLGGIGGIAPNRKKDLAALVTKAMIGGAIASWLTATIAGILL